MLCLLDGVTGILPDTELSLIARHALRPVEADRLVLGSHIADASTPPTVVVELRAHVGKLEQLARATRPLPAWPSSQLPSAEEAERAAARYNSLDYMKWPHEDIILAQVLLPRVVKLLIGFDRAAIASQTAANYSMRDVHARLDASPLLRRRCTAITDAVQPAILAAGESAADGMLPLAYARVESSPALRQQRACARPLLALLLLYSPWMRRCADGPPEEVAVLRHIEMYLFAEPTSLEPSGELLSGPQHAGQHRRHRQMRREAQQELGGYAAHLVQRHGTGERGGRLSTGSVNLMTAGFELCARALDIKGVTMIMAHGGYLVDDQAKDLGLSCDAPIDLIDGPHFFKAVDLRPIAQGGSDDATLLRVLRPPTLIKRISVSNGSLREGSAVQQEVLNQPEALEALSFHRVKREAYRRSVAHRRPMAGTPVFCFDAVDYGGQYGSAPPAPFAL